MTENKEKFSDLKPKERGDVTFGDDWQWKIKGIKDIGNNFSIHIENVLLVNYETTIIELFLKLHVAK